jgi:dolichol-phosphate mannosyltransferase
MRWHGICISGDQQIGEGMTDKILDSNRFLKFSAVGLAGTTVNMAVLYLGYQVAGLPLLLASVLAVETAVLNNFLWNNIWTFRQRTFALIRLVKFNLVSLGALTVNVAVLYLLVTMLDLHYLAANLAAIVAATGLNFVGNSLWTWDGAT